jgi:hypothetical protein
MVGGEENIQLFNSPFHFKAAVARDFSSPFLPGCDSLDSTYLAMPTFRTVSAKRKRIDEVM